MVTLTKDQPVYLLAGDEEFLKQKNLAEIKSRFLDKASQDFNFNIFYAGPAALEKILECAQTAPFLGEKRVVLVRRIEEFSASEQEFILAYLKAPRKQTILILETTQNNLNQKFFAEICKYARLIFCKAVQGNELFSWIRGQAELRGKRITEEALRLLVENLGNNLQLLASSLENLVLYIGEEKTISAEAVQKLVGPDVSASAFELFEAAFARKQEKALQILDSLLKEGVNSSQILGALTYRLTSDRSRIGARRCDQYLLELQQADSDIKRGRRSQRLALELLLEKLLT